ncbi:hypothetical protein B0T22DRAFT_269802 [Podospora appendiculata]|uniref:3'(2'),5'-bisphosphate nucleotidase n=1 Tax=Podospora appendiculata TaxID=314037 RepID=A0AAE0X3M0_9PEZI|nr:hypothetical protein B0T22DRAFT_269802 [Podospora appendiculata]
MTTESLYDAELAVALTAIRAAAKISRAVLDSSNKGALLKADLTPVTVADYAVQAVLTDTLHSAFPLDGLVGEESSGDLHSNPALVDHVLSLIKECDDGSAKQAPSTPESLCSLIDLCSASTPTGPDSGRAWIFDPIDGTATFLRGEQYAINVALLIDGQQILSAVACPLLSPTVTPTAPLTNTTLSRTGCILTAIRGHGTFLHPLLPTSSSPPPILLPRHCDAVPLSSLRSVTSYNTLPSGLDPLHAQITRSLGAAFPDNDLLGWIPRWTALALGQANMTVWIYRSRTRHAKIWDHAGAMLLFEEVGGMVTDVDGRPIDLSRGRLLEGNFGFVAAPRGVHHLVLRAVRETLRKEGRGDLLG